MIRVVGFHCVLLFLTCTGRPSILSPLNNYPIDPYQLRVPGTSTSVIFSKYGTPLHYVTVMALVAKTQYDIVQEVVAARGDGPVAEPRYQWDEDRTAIKITRPLSSAQLTWLMVADTVEGIRLFFEGLQGWFETSITILDDEAGIVGTGWVDYQL